MPYVMPFTGRRKCIGFPHLLSLRNVAHSANDGTAVYFFIRLARYARRGSISQQSSREFVVAFGVDHERVGFAA